MSSEKQRRRVGIASPVRTRNAVRTIGGARDLAEGADMGQAGGAVAGLEQDAAVRIAALLDPRDDLPRLLERPCLRPLRGLAERRRDLDLGEAGRSHLVFSPIWGARGP